MRQLEEEARLAPRGQVAVLFTDIEASSRLWRAKPKEMRVALGVHFMALRRSVAANGGYEVKTEGDAMFAVFPTVVAAVRAACQSQALLPQPLPLPPTIRPHRPLRAELCKAVPSDQSAACILKGATYLRRRLIG